MVSMLRDQNNVRHGHSQNRGKVLKTVYTSSILTGSDGETGSSDIPVDMYGRISGQNKTVYQQRLACLNKSINE